MAKIRRIVRKLKLNTPQSLDDQYWPVVVALVVLGGFAMGSILAYLRLDDPRWYANAILWLVIVVLSTAGLAAALAMVENRTFRRSMQLAVVLGLLFHTVLFVASIEFKVFDRIFEVFLTSNETMPSRQPVTVPEYFETARDSRMRQDFERPVETDTPQPEVQHEEIQRQETEPETVPPEPQPTPVPEPEQTVKPNVVKKQETDETAPRFSTQQSQLSRRVTQARPTPTARAAAAQVDNATPAPSANLQAQDSDIQRQATQAQMQRRPAEQEPSTTASQPTTSVARRTEENAPDPQSTATPTFRRRVDRAVAVPRTQVELSETPVNTRRTDPGEIRPNTTLARKQTTASPEREQERVEPTPDTNVSATAQSQRRQLNTEARPDIAQTPVSVPNRQTRTTTRPDLATVATEVSPNRNPAPPQRDQAPAHVAATPVRRATTESGVQRTAVADDLAATAHSSPANVARRQTAPVPAPPVESIAQTDSVHPTPRATASPEISASAVTVDVTPARAPSSRPAAAQPQALAGSLSRSQTDAVIGRTAAATEPAMAPLAEPRPVARRQASQSPTTPPTPSPVAATGSAPASTPRQPTTRSSIATRTSAEVAGATAVASAANSSGGTPAPASTAAGRQTPSAGAMAARSNSEPALVANGGSPTAAASTRRPSGESAPDLATTPVSAPARRQAADSVPAVTTMAAAVSATSAPTRSDSDQPRPSSASVARQSDLNPTGTRSQHSREVQSASTATQVARFTPQRRTSSDAPSVAPNAPIAAMTARTPIPSTVTASPTNVESPVVAQSTRGVASPAAEPARTSLAKAVTGTAGVGQGRNLDRARPAADSPAMVASASARRAESMQQTPSGPALAPQAPALVRRSAADAQVPGTTMQAQPLADIAITAGADQPDLLAANASAAVTRADANAAQGPVTATQGPTEVDLGPTRVVSEGQTGRASGGGQPTMNFETDAPRIARSDNVGGAPLAAITATTVVDAPTAPAAVGGGGPTVPQTDVQAMSVARTDAGGAGPISGGPAKSVEIGPATEVSMAEQIAESTLARAELAEAVPGATAAGGGDDQEDEEERKRRLARARNNQASPATSVAADTGLAASQLASGDSPGGHEALATAIDRASTAAADMARSDRLSEEPGVADMASAQLSSSPASRTAVPEDVPPGPALAAQGGPAIGRTIAAVGAMVADTQAQPAPAISGTGPSAQPQPAASSVAAVDRRAETSGSGSNSTAADAPQTELASAGQPTAARVQRADFAEPDPLQQPNVDGMVGGGPRRAIRTGASGPQLASAAATPPDGTAASAAVAPVGGPLATALARIDAGGAPGTGQRSDLDEPGPTSGASGGEVLAMAEYTRSEAVEAAAGTPDIGGGTATPTRSAAGPMLATNTIAENVSLAGAPDSGGIPDGSQLAAQGSQAGRLPTGRTADPNDGPVGAIAATTVVDVTSIGQVGLAFGDRSSSSSSDDGPAVGQMVDTGAPLKRSSRTALPAGSIQVAVVDMPSEGSFDAVGQANEDHNARGTNGELEITRQSTEGGLAVNMEKIEGPGGLGEEYTVDVGLNSRRALRESLQVQVRTARFVRHNVGGLPNVSTAAIVAAEPFRRRMDRSSGDAPGDGGGSPPPLTEETIELGLAFLSRQQLPDGSWSLQGINGEQAALVTDTGATALALLAFQGAGYNHREHKYADVVRAAVDYLIKHQKEDGDLFLPLDDESNRSVWLYSHGLATLALCEAYGMTQDPNLREPAQRAMDFCVASQHPDRGGWRYAPQFGADTSVTGWMMMALKSGELAGLDVPQDTYNMIRRWLERSQGSSTETHLYRYNPYAPDTDTQRHGRVPSKTMTSVGLLMRLYLGWTQETPDMVRGADYLAENLPAIGTSRTPERDTYYWYYATQVMYHMGGDHWQAWNGRLHPLLVDSQVRQGSMAGSWSPRDPVPDRWGPHAGRLYVTTMNLLSLEVYYRHLPLYKDTLR